MRVTVEIANDIEMKKLIAFFKTMQLDSIQIVTEHTAHLPIIQKGNKRLNPKELFGIWQEEPRDIEVIRKNAWKRAG